MRTPRSLSALSGYIRNIQEQERANKKAMHHQQLDEELSTSKNKHKKNRKLYTSLVHESGSESSGSKQSADLSISEYYYQGENNKWLMANKTDRAGGILVYNVQSLLPICKFLAAEYRLSNSDPVAHCFHNREVALMADRSDLAQLWSMAAHLLRLPANTALDTNTLTGHPWAVSPLVRATVMKMLVCG